MVSKSIFDEFQAKSGVFDTTPQTEETDYNGFT